MRLTEFSSSRTQWHKHNKFPAPNGARFHRTNQPETCHTRYDGAGNVQVMVTADGTVTNSYDRANRLTASVSPLGTTTFTYDANNRRTGMQTPNGNITTYTWTDDNQLAAVALPNSGGTVTNTYDGDGLRFSRTDSSGTNSYLWNGQVLEAELGSGNTVSTWYTQGMGDGNQGTGEFGDIVSTRDVAGSATSWPQYDASGNVSQTTDSSSSITTTLAYDTFGVVTDNSGPANPTVAWQGRQGYQFESTLGPAGLQYVRQRWYDPATRQFISPDPLGFAGGDVNLFRYAGNNPISRNDPSGTDMIDDLTLQNTPLPSAIPLVPTASSGPLVPPTTAPAPQPTPSHLLTSRSPAPLLVPPAIGITPQDADYASGTFTVAGMRPSDDEWGGWPRLPNSDKGGLMTLNNYVPDWQYESHWNAASEGAAGVYNVATYVANTIDTLISIGKEKPFPYRVWSGRNGMMESIVYSNAFRSFHRVMLQKLQLLANTWSRSYGCTSAIGAIPYRTTFNGSTSSAGGFLSQFTPKSLLGQLTVGSYTVDVTTVGVARQWPANSLSKGLILGKVTFSIHYYCRDLWHLHVGEKSPLHHHLPGNFLNILAWSEQVAVPIARYCTGKGANIVHADGW